MQSVHFDVLKMIFFICFHQMNPAALRLFSETRVVKGEIWNRREKNSGEKRERKQRRMKNMLSGEEGEKYFVKM